MLKRCPRCKVQKDTETCFYINRAAYDGICTYCKECANELNKTVEGRNQPAKRRNWARKMAKHLKLSGRDY